MSANAVAETTQTKQTAPRRRVLVYTFIGLLVVISFSYFSLNNSRDNAANNDFYRILYEASNKFNENLNQLRKMHVNEENPNSIRTQLPSYSRINPQDKSPIKDPKFDLNGQEISVVDGSTPKASLEITDILPFPKQGFSQYLFASSVDKVLATVGHEKNISIVSLSSISREIEKSKDRYQLKLSESQSSDNGKDGQLLPSYSSHVDMKLSHKEFRIFIFPFSLDTPLSIGGSTNTLYLVGLLPKHELHAEGSGYWDVSLLLVTIVSLLFMWTLLRLYLLPNNQSISPFYRNFTLFSSYCFFIVLIALMLALMQKTTLQASKDSAATAYAEDLSTQLENDLFDVFDGLADYRDFYHNFLDELYEFPEANESTGAEDIKGAATEDFSRMIKKSLASICKPIDKAMLKGYAFTSYRKYQYAIDCSSEVNEEVEGKTSIRLQKLDQSAEQMVLRAHQKNVNSKHGLGFMLGNQKLKVEKGTVESYISLGDHSQISPGNIFTVFAINDEGHTTLPPIYLQEYNAPPKVHNLTHRDYYKKVRDYQGWRLCRTAEEKKNHQCAFNNVYIQRVLNMGDGTRGTTISMPMYDLDSDEDTDILAYTIGADVILPSLSLAAPAPYDFTYMVIDRNSGDVLFHSDEDRTLVENLFYASNDRSNLSQWVKAGLDHYPKLSKKIIEGHYHGQPGRFVSIPASVDAWAIVVFYPDDNLDALLANQFLLISVSFAISLLGLVGLLYICRYFFCTNILKNKLSIPEKINGRVIIMVGSIMLSVIYSLYYIGLLYDLAEFWQLPASFFSLAVPSVGALILLLYLFNIYKNHFVDAGISTHAKGFKSFFSMAILLSTIHLGYLHFVAQMPIKALGFHYQQVHCNWLNYEQQESNKMALSRYPNSITQQRIDPENLLPKAPKLTETWDVNGACDMHSPQVEPDDYLNLSSLMGATYLWQWVNATIRSADLPITPTLAIQKKEFNMALCPVVVYSILILAIIWIWLVFVRGMLWRRLYCSDRFLQHIERMTQSKFTLELDQYHKRLIIESGRIKLNGIGLALQLRTAAMHENKSAGLKLLAGFETLYQLSPCLQNFGVNNSFLPNLKLNVEEGSDSKKLDVQIWDIETCLAQAESRKHLLDLIMEIKSLTLANQLNSFTIFAEYHSLHRVKMKDPLSINKDSMLGHTEYLSWAECLMDFNVKVAEDLEQGLDEQFLKQEIDGFPELFFLSPDTLVTSEAAEESLWNKHHDANISAKWKTINYILLRVEALYRFKWESCSNAEKLALLNLDKQHRLNPSNTQMIEHLALNGLVRVRLGRLEIMNSSFAHFIRNAETTDTVKHLVNQSEAGFWKDYQLPLGLLMILIIGGIALTSGESIYIIAASVAGVIGTIASVASSAKMLGGQLK